MKEELTRDRQLEPPSDVEDIIQETQKDGSKKREDTRQTGAKTRMWEGGRWRTEMLIWMLFTYA